MRLRKPLNAKAMSQTPSLTETRSTHRCQPQEDLFQVSETSNLFTSNTDWDPSNKRVEILERCFLQNRDNKVFLDLSTCICTQGPLSTRLAGAVDARLDMVDDGRNGILIIS